MDLRKAIEHLAGTKAAIHWCFLSGQEAEWLEIEEAIAALGKSVRRTTLYESCDESPYVILAIDAEVQGVRFHAQWSRPAMPAEIEEANAREEWSQHQENYMTTRLVG